MTRPALARRSLLLAGAAVLVPAAARAEARVSTATPFKKGDILVAATVMDDPNDDHAGTGRLLQYDAELNLKGTLWIKQTRHKLSGLVFGPDKVLYGFAPLNHAVIEVGPDAKERPLFAFADRAFSNVSFARDGTLLFGEHLVGTKTGSRYVSTRLPLIKGRDVVGDGHVFRFSRDRKLIAEYPTAVHGGIEGYHGVTSLVLADDDARAIYISETGNRILQYDLKARRQLPDLAVFNDDPRVRMLLWLTRLDKTTLLAVTGANMVAIDQDTGRVLREYTLGTFGWAAATPSIDGKFILVGNFMDGDVAKVSVADGSVVARANIGEKRSLSGIAQFPG
jgi:outer membrane protein assembly factor BamB